MTTSPTTPPSTPTSTPTSTTSPARMSWLTDQVAAWEADGLLDRDQGRQVLARYEAGRRVPVARLMLALGACFAGVGAIWLVAANLESLSPTARLLLVGAAWLAALVGGEVLATRGTGAARVGAVRLLTALLVGAVVFQAAQSLQVPAWEPWLVGCWGGAALVHAYASRAVAPLVLATLTLATYVVWGTLDAALSPAPLVVALGAAGLAAVALAAVHEERAPAFAAVWRTTGAGLLLVSVVVAAVPLDGGWTDLRTWLSGPVVAVLAAVVLLVGAAVLTGGRLARGEVLGGATVLAGSVLLLAWQVSADAVVSPSVADLVRALSGLTLCAAAAVAVAVSGTVREQRTLVALGTTALVVATTLQAFTVFAPVLEGAWLFLVLGVALAGAGLTFDRTRRQVAAAL